MSGNRYLRFEKARTSSVYKVIMDKAIARLTAYGVFSKEVVLQDADLAVISDAEIRWDYIKKMIEDDRNTELIPLAGAAFKRHSLQMARQFPGKFIAQGHGKKTAGFCIASQVNGHFVLEQLKLKTNKAKGMIRAADKTRRIGHAAGVPGLNGTSTLPAPEPTVLPPPDDTTT